MTAVVSIGVHQDILALQGSLEEEDEEEGGAGKEEEEEKEVKWEKNGESYFCS